MEIKFEGFEELQRKLEKAANKVPKSAEHVLHNVGEKTKVKMQELAPVDTWYLHDHIFHNPSPLASEIHSAAAYSGYVNKGTRYMMAQPFFEYGLTYAVEKMDGLLEEVLNETLRGV